jgi:low temperature requirement protein LtrA
MGAVRHNAVVTVDDTEIVRVSTIELFFDLVFVFTITQLTTALVNRPTATGLLSVVLMLGLIWWMYGGYAWLTNDVAPNRADRRLLLMLGMAGFLVIALAIPGAFSGDGLAFGVGYVVVTVVHLALFTRTSTRTAVRAILGISPFNLVSALLVLAGGIVGGPVEYVLWACAFIGQAITPLLTELSGFRIQPSHFVERHGAVLLIVLGESVVAVGIGVSGQRVTPALVGVALLGLVLVAGLWWLYFGGDDERAEQALRQAPAPVRPRLVINAYGYAFMPILLGVVGLAAGVRRSIGHSLETLPLEPALTLAAGMALYFLGTVAFRRSLGLGPNRFRVAAAAVALASTVLGLRADAVAQVVVLLALPVVTLTLEWRLRPR